MKNIPPLHHHNKNREETDMIKVVKRKIMNFSSKVILLEANLILMLHLNYKNLTNSQFTLSKFYTRLKKQ